MALNVLDLGEVEQAVYEEIVCRQITSLQHLTHAIEQPRRLVCAALERLQILGLISRKTGELNTFVAAPPEIALEALLLEKEVQLRRARLAAARLTSAHRRSANGTDPGHLIEVVTGRETVLQRFEQAQLSCRNEIRLIDRPPYVSEDPRANVALERIVVERGVRFRRIYDARGLASYHQISGDVEDSVSAGVDARVLPSTPIQLLLVDDRLAMLPLQSTPSEIDSAAIVHSSALLVGLSSLFELLWDRALPLVLPVDDAPVQSNQPTRAERRLLALLTAGVNDETIAKHLGISQRTTQRRVHALLERLDVNTRFQAALRAVALGWLPILASDEGSPQMD